MLLLYTRLCVLLFFFLLVLPLRPPGSSILLLFLLVLLLLCNQHHAPGELLTSLKASQLTWPSNYCGPALCQQPDLYTPKSFPLVHQGSDSVYHYGCSPLLKRTPTDVQYHGLLPPAKVSPNTINKRFLSCGESQCNQKTNKKGSINPDCSL